MLKPPSTKSYRLDIPISPKKPSIQREADDEYVLTLVPFTNAPKINFGQVKVNRAVVLNLLILNTQSHDIKLTANCQELAIDHIEFDMPKSSQINFKIKWEPVRPGNYKYAILFESSSGHVRLKYIVHAFGVCPAPIIKKPIRKPLAVVQPRRPLLVKVDKENAAKTKNPAQVLPSAKSLFDIQTTSKVITKTPSLYQIYSDSKETSTRFVSKIPVRRPLAVLSNQLVQPVETCKHSNISLDLERRRIRDQFILRQAAAIKIQKTWRMYSQRIEYQRILNRIIKLQNWVRGRLDRLKYLKLRQSVLIIQKTWRMKIERKKYVRQVKSIIRLQRWTRSHSDTFKYLELKRNVARKRAEWERNQQVIRLEIRHFDGMKSRLSGWWHGYSIQMQLADFILYRLKVFVEARTNFDSSSIQFCIRNFIKILVFPTEPVTMRSLARQVQATMGFDFIELLQPQCFIKFITNIYDQFF